MYSVECTNGLRIETREFDDQSVELEIYDGFTLLHRLKLHCWERDNLGLEIGLTLMEGCEFNEKYHEGYVDGRREARQEAAGWFEEIDEQLEHGNVPNVRKNLQRLAVDWMAG